MTMNSMWPLHKIAVTGARGMLGTAILERFNAHYDLFLTSQNKGIEKDNVSWELFNLLDSEKLIRWLTKNKPSIVIHCAALVNVDECEKEVTKITALHVDTTALIAKTISSWGGRLVYISTDAVFNGIKSGLYDETDKPSPLSMYGHTKYLGELKTLNASQNNLVLRTTIFGHQNIAERSSFSDWILKGLIDQTPLPLFTDVEFTPIYVDHFADILFDIITNYPGIAGLFHLSGATKLSKYDFAIELAKQFDLPINNIIPSTLSQENLLALRAKNMALSNHKLSKLMNRSFPAVQDGIRCLHLSLKSENTL